MIMLMETGQGTFFFFWLVQIHFTTTIYSLLYYIHTSIKGGHVRLQNVPYNSYTTLPLLYTHYHTVYYTCLHIYVQHTYRYTHAYAQPLYYSTTTVYSLPYRLLHMFTHMYTHTDTHIHIYNPYATLPPLYTDHTTLWCVCIHMYTHIHYTHTYVHI